MGRGGGSFDFSRDFNAETPNLTYDFPLTEPLIATSLHIDGFMASAIADVVHFFGWQTIAPMSEGTPGERRVVVRFAMSEMEARAFKCALGGALREGY